jgi:hypothetical protein
MTLRRTLPVLVTAAILTTTFGITPADAREGVHLCRASAARVALLGIFLEPSVANPQGVPCRTDADTLLTLPVNPLANASVGTAFTTSGERATTFVAFAGVPSIGLAVTGLQSTAGSDCVDGATPTSFGRSSIASVKIGNQTLLNVKQPVTIPLGPLGTLYLNQRIKNQNGQSSTTIQRAVHLETPLGSVTLAEAIAGVSCPAP